MEDFQDAEDWVSQIDELKVKLQEKDYTIAILDKELKDKEAAREKEKQSHKKKTKELENSIVQKGEEIKRYQRLLTRKDDHNLLLKDDIRRLDRTYKDLLSEKRRLDETVKLYEEKEDKRRKSEKQRQEAKERKEQVEREIKERVRIEEKERERVRSEINMKKRLSDERDEFAAYMALKKARTEQ